MLAVMLASLLPYPRWSLTFVTDAWPVIHGGPELEDQFVRPKLLDLILSSGSSHFVKSNS